MKSGRVADVAGVAGGALVRTHHAGTQLSNLPHLPFRYFRRLRLRVVHAHGQAGKRYLEALAKEVKGYFRKAGGRDCVGRGAEDGYGGGCNPGSGEGSTQWLPRLGWPFGILTTSGQLDFAMATRLPTPLHPPIEARYMCESDVKGIYIIDVARPQPDHVDPTKIVKVEFERKDGGHWQLISIASEK